MHALVIDDTIQQVGGLPRSARRLDDDGLVLGLRDAPTDLVRACGYLPVVEDRPPLTANEQHGQPVYTIRADDVLATYPIEPIPADELDRRTKSANVDQAVATLRQWAVDAQAVGAQGGNVTQAQHKALFTRLGTFMDRFADLIESEGRHTV